MTTIAAREDYNNGTMWRGVMNELGELGYLLPLYTAGRCLLVRGAIGGCDRCAAVCPHDAVEFLGAGEGFGVRIREDVCTGCGSCVQACPSGALEYDLLGTLEHIQAQKHTPEVTLCCSQSTENGGAGLPCLGRVSSAQILAAGLQELPLALIHGDCTKCSVGGAEVPSKVAAVIEQAEQQAGRPLQVKVTQGDGAEVGLSRRQAFAALFRLSVKTVAKQLPEQPLPFVDWRDDAQKVPQEWRWRKHFLRHQEIVYWPAPLVEEGCIDCPVCANVCPTRAIRREFNDEGGVKLFLELEACTGCMACVRSCPPQVMRMNEYWHHSAFKQPLQLRGPS